MPASPLDSLLQNLPDALALALIPLAAIQLAIWLIILYRVERTMRLIPRATAGIALADASPPTGRVCIIIPGHNEERAIGPLIASLRALNWPDLRVLLALDRCTDNTAAVAREAIAADPRIEIIEITACPQEWAGKVNAIWTVASTHPAALESDYVLFADADTTFHPQAIRATLALMRDRQVDFLSLVSTLTHDRSFERIAQPIAGMELFRQYPIVRANRRDRSERRAFANGQFMLFRTSAYRAFGGHEAVKDALLEDLALAELAARNNIPVGVFFADGLIRCRMYESWSQFRSGWKRIYIEAAHLKPRRLLRSAALVAFTGCVIPVAVGVFTAAVYFTRPESFAWILGLIAIIIRLAVLARVYRVGGSPVWCIIFAWIGAWIIAGILGESANDLHRGTPTRWGGREYIRTPRK
jgi:chlorobactene glucosyltransferase